MPEVTATRWWVLRVFIAYLVLREGQVAHAIPKRMLTPL